MSTRVDVGIRHEARCPCSKELIAMVSEHEEERRDAAVLAALGQSRRNVADLRAVVNRTWFGRPLSEAQVRTVLRRLEADARVVLDEGMWEAV